MPKVRVPLRDRYRTSKAIFRESIALVRKERDLWLFPILASLVMLAMFTVMGLGAWLLVASGLSWSAWTGVILLAILLPVSYPFGVLTTMLNAALLFGLHERMARRKCTRRQAWARARAQLGPIARFSALTLLVSGALALVGQVLDKLRLVPYVGQALQVVGGLAWAVASFFVLPILVVQRERGALAALRGSAALARDQWGKATAGMVTIALVFLVPFFILLGVAMLLSVGGFALVIATGAGGAASFLLGTLPMLVVVLLYLLAGLPVQQAAHLAYQAGLYRYATTGKVPRGFSRSTVVDAWEPYRQA